MTTAEITPLSRDESHSFFAWRNVHVLVIGSDITPDIVEAAYESGVAFERRFPGPHAVLVDYHGSLRVPPFAVREMVADVARKTTEHAVVARAIVIRGGGVLARALRGFVTAAAGIGLRYPQRFCPDVRSATTFLESELRASPPFVDDLTRRVEAEQRRLGLRIE